MKKILALAVGMLLIPFTAFGMEMMSDSDMDSITGQSGVAISVDNIQLYTSGGEETWFETSYVGTSTNGGSAAVGLVYGGNTATYLFINKIGNPNDLQDGTIAHAANGSLRGDYSGMAELDLAGLNPRQNPSVLSIRVAQHTTGGIFGPDAGTDGDGAYIEIGLPTLEIFTAGGSAEELGIYVLGSESYDGSNPIGSATGNEAFRLGTIWTGSGDGATTAVLGGRIGITSIGQLDQDNTSVSYE